MQKLDIKITSGKIRSFSVHYSNNDALPSVTVSIDLLTAGGKTITSYSISSDHWNDDQKFEIPNEVFRVLPEIERALEEIVTKHCQCSTLQVT